MHAWKWWLSAAALTMVVGCRTEDLTVPYGHGQLAVQLTGDGARGAGAQKRTAGADGEVTEIHVTVVKVTAHVPGGWTTISDETVSVDLLDLDATVESLGLAELPVGEVSQLRLYTASEGNYVVLADGTRDDLKIPSGAQSGIKVKGPFHITECNRSIVSLAFDGKHSIHVHGTGAGRYILRPVIRVHETDDRPLTCTGGPDGGTGEEPGEEDPVLTPPAGPGEACSAPSDCLSGDCTGGVCAPSAPGAPCVEHEDCGSGVCLETGACGGDGGGTGSECSGNSECLSGGCEVEVCTAGGQGAPCAVTADCAEGFACEGGACEAVFVN